MDFAGGHVLSAPGDPLVALVAYLIVILGLLGVVLSARTPAERAVRLLFLYLVYGTFEVAVKRLTHFAWYVYPIKFGLFFLVVAAWWTARPSIAAHRLRPPLLVVVSLYIALAALQIFNPYQGNPIVGVLGWMTDFMYVVLYFVAFDLLRDERVVLRLLWVTAALGVASAVSCVGEMWYGAEQLQRMYPTFVPLLVFTPGGDVFYRPTSLVPYMEIFGIAAMVAMLAMRRQRVVLLLGGIALCVAASLFHAIRITWVTTLLFLALFTLLDRRKSWIGASVVVACVALSIQTFDLGGGMLEQSLESATTPVQTFERNRLGGLLSITRIVSEYPLGLGVGESSPGLRFLDGRRGSQTRLGTHNYLTDLAGQLSLAGPLLLLAFGFGIGRLGVGAPGHLGGSDVRGIVIKAATALFGAVLISFFGGGALGAYPENEYFWLMAGVIARLASPAVNIRLAAVRVPAGRGLVRMRREIAAGGVARGRGAVR
ncbi:MAG TPA: hypothetical protein VG871_20850 [Vicinamibacterales bacterium]|nr:hypothetical protein [Vicinamibacterales bacterium]